MPPYMCCVACACAGAFLSDKNWRLDERLIDLANLNLNEIVGDLEKTYGNWSVSFGSVDNPKSCEFVFLVRADKEARAKFWETLYTTGRLVNGTASQEEVADAAGESDDYYEYMMCKTIEAMRPLATNKTTFNSLVKWANGNVLLWDKILKGYFEHFDLMQGELKPSQNS